MPFSTLIWILVIVSGVCCAMGFYRFVWFMSVGYGFAISGCGIAMLIVSLVRNGLITTMLPFYLQCALFIIYGLRLGLFLMLREMKSASYRKVLDAQTGKPVPFFVKIFMWVFMAFLYAFEVSPAAYRLDNGAAMGDACQWIGMLIMAAGIAIEAVADKQKSASKLKNPGKPAMDGLYRYTRCPNYFGEMTVWLGVLISGANVMQGWQWLIALIGFVAIEYIMVSGAQRVEKRQGKSYGAMPEYREYVKKTPVLFPFIPIYSMVREDRKK